MYTRCPSCLTVFRISSADLRAADGEVVCGRCDAQFNALASLSETAEEATVVLRPAAGAAAGAGDPDLSQTGAEPLWDIVARGVVAGGPQDPSPGPDQTPAQFGGFPAREPDASAAAPDHEDPQTAGPAENHPGAAEAGDTGDGHESLDDEVIAEAGGGPESVSAGSAGAASSVAAPGRGDERQPETSNESPFAGEPGPSGVADAPAGGESGSGPGLAGHTDPEGHGASRQDSGDGQAVAGNDEIGGAAPGMGETPADGGEGYDADDASEEPEGNGQAWVDEYQDQVSLRVDDETPAAGEDPEVRGDNGEPGVAAEREGDPLGDAWREGGFDDGESDLQARHDADGEAVFVDEAEPGTADAADEGGHGPAGPDAAVPDDADEDSVFADARAPATAHDDGIPATDEANDVEVVFLDDSNEERDDARPESVDDGGAGDGLCAGNQDAAAAPSGDREPGRDDGEITLPAGTVAGSEDSLPDAEAAGGEGDTDEGDEDEDETDLEAALEAELNALADQAAEEWAVATGVTDESAFAAAEHTGAESTSAATADAHAGDDDEEAAVEIDIDDEIDLETGEPSNTDARDAAAGAAESADGPEPGDRPAATGAADEDLRAEDDDLDDSNLEFDVPQDQWDQIWEAGSESPEAAREPEADAEVIVLQGDGEEADGRAPGEAAPEAEERGLTIPESSVSAPFAQSGEQEAPKRSRWWLAAAVVLGVFLGLQWLHYNRSALLTHPTVGPVLGGIYDSIGVEARPAWELASFRILESAGVQDPANPGTLRLSVRFTNSAPVPQPLPLLRVTLEDRWGEPVAMRDFAPREYIASVTGDQRLSPGKATQGNVTIVDPGPTADGYRLDLCYPDGSQGAYCLGDLPGR